jgi:hypothetical protein
LGSIGFKRASAWVRIGFRFRGALFVFIDLVGSFRVFILLLMRSGRADGVAGGVDFGFGAHVGLIVHYREEADEGCFRYGIDFMI